MAKPDSKKGEFKIMKEDKKANPDNGNKKKIEMIKDSSNVAPKQKDPNHQETISDKFAPK